MLVPPLPFAARLTFSPLHRVLAVRSPGDRMRQCPMPGQDPSGRVVTRCGHPANLPPNSSSAQATGLLQALARQQRSCCCPSARPAVQDMRQATTENHSPGYVRCQQGSFPPFFLTVLRRMACNSGVVLSPDWADAFHVAHFSCTKGTSAFSNAVDSLLTTCCVRLEPGECLPLRQLLKKSQCNALCSRPPLSREMSGSPECPTSIPLGICRLVLSRFPLLLLLC